MTLLRHSSTHLNKKNVNSHFISFGEIAKNHFTHSILRYDISWIEHRWRHLAYKNEVREKKTKKTYESKKYCFSLDESVRCLYCCLHCVWRSRLRNVLLRETVWKWVRSPSLWKLCFVECDFFSPFLCYCFCRFEVVSCSSQRVDVICVVVLNQIDWFSVLRQFISNA